MYQSDKCLFLETYSAARSKLRQAEETSALETDRDDNVGRPQRKKRRALTSSGNESSPEKNLKKPPKAEVLRKKSQDLLPMPCMPSAPFIGLFYLFEPKLNCIVK